MQTAHESVSDGNRGSVITIRQRYCPTRLSSRPKARLGRLQIQRGRKSPIGPATRDLGDQPAGGVDLWPVARRRHLPFGEQIGAAERERHVERPWLAGGADTAGAGRASGLSLAGIGVLEPPGAVLLADRHPVLFRALDRTRRP